MELRVAKSNDIWRKLFNRSDRKISDLRIGYQGVQELGDGELSFRFPINLICGENGVGKSAAIWTLAQALGLDTNLEGSHKASRPKSNSGIITRSEIAYNSKPGSPSLTSFLAEHNEQNPECNITIIDTGLQVPHLLSALRRDANPQDLIDGVTAIELKVNELLEIQELTGKNYTKVDIFEVSDYGDFLIFPYFTVTYGAATYTSTEMGLGEFALLFIYWKLRNLPNTSIILIEEPESFVAPRSQRVFIDFLAALCNARGHFAILSSHSGTIAERIPNAAIQLCSRRGSEVLFTLDPPPNLLVDRVALYLRRRFVCLVEDSAGRAFLRAIIERLDSRIAADIDILISGSNGEMTQALRSIRPCQEERIRFVGVYDGDQISSLPDNILWPAICLPGFTDPDHEMRALVANHPAHEVATALRVKREDLIVVLSGLEGKDKHDWLNSFAKAFKLTTDQIFHQLFPLWLASNDGIAHEFVGRLRKAFGLH